MSTTFSLAALLAFVARETGEVVLALVTIDHPTMSSPLRFVRDTQSWESRGETYSPLWMDVVMTSNEGSEPGRAVVTIDAVDQVAQQALDGLPSSPAVTIEYVLASEPDEVIASNVDLIIDNLVFQDMDKLVANLGPPHHYNELVPGVLMNRANTPALFFTNPNT